MRSPSTDAGAFAIVTRAIPDGWHRLYRTVAIPRFGMGRGARDGQVMVIPTMLGASYDTFVPPLLKQLREVANRSECRDGIRPSDVRVGPVSRPAMSPARRRSGFRPVTICPRSARNPKVLQLRKPAMFATKNDLSEDVAPKHELS